MHYWLRFKGVSSDDLGVIAVHLGQRQRAEQEKDVIQVPFSDRNDVVLHPHFLPYTRKMEIAFRYEQISQVHNWLLGNGRLSTPLDTGLYFEAYVDSISDPKIYEAGVYTCKVNFVVEPFAYHQAGVEEINLSSPALVLNPGTWISKPIYKISGSGEGHVFVNGDGMDFTDLVNDTIVDTKLKACYSGQENRGKYMKGNFLTLQPGDNTVSYSGGITGVSIIPRWCDL